MDDQLKAAIHAWIRDDLPFAAQASLTPNHVKKLCAKLASAVAAEHEAIAKWADHRWGDDFGSAIRARKG